MTKQCKLCGVPMGKRAQGEICSSCRRKHLKPEPDRGKQYVVGELAVALLALPKEQYSWPVKVGATWGGPDSELVIEACQPESEEPYVWIGDPSV